MPYEMGSIGMGDGVVRHLVCDLPCLALATIFHRITEDGRGNIFTDDSEIPLLLICSVG